MKAGRVRAVLFQVVALGVAGAITTAAAAQPKPPRLTRGTRKALEQARTLQRPSGRTKPANETVQPATQGRGLKTGGGASSGSASGSMAANYGHGATLSVNERTFELTLDA